MTRFVAGLLIGFFLAVGLMAGFVQIYLGPYYETVKTSQPYAQGFYNLAHTQTYAETQAFVAKVNEAAAAIATVPVIGNAFESSKVAQYTQMALDTLSNAKSSSEVMLQLTSMTLSLMEMAIPLLLISIIMVGAGCYMYYKEEKAAAPKKGRKR